MTNYNEEYIDYRTFLRRKIDVKQKRNPRYSLRAFARKAGVSQSLLSQVLGGQKNLSIQSALKLINTLDFEDNEKELFLKLIELNTIKSSQMKECLFQEIKKNISVEDTEAVTQIIGGNMFTGKYIKLRAHEKSDSEDFSKLFHEDYEICYNNNPKLILPVSKEVEEDFFTTESEREISLAVEELDSGKFIGYVYIYGINNKNRTCKFEIVLGKEYRNQKIEGDAAIVMSNFIFNELNMRKIVYMVLDYDKHSLSTYKSIGFKEEARHKEEFFRNGEYHDQIYLTFFQKDFNYYLNTDDLAIIKRG